MTRKEEIEQASENYYNEVKYLSDLSAFPIAAFKAGAEWADKTLFDKVCKWLINAFHKNNNGTFNYVGGNDCSIVDIVNILKQTMEE